MRRLAFLVALASLAGACGKKGPPLPPLVKLPEAPRDFAAARRDDVVELQFTVPAANTDGTKPANVERVEVYAFTGPPDVTDKDLLDSSNRIGSVPVKAPPDPDAAVEPGEEEPEAPAGPGLDQGASAHLTETMTPALMTEASAPSKPKKKSREKTSAEGPLLGPFSEVPRRTYVAVGISTRGRKGSLSQRAAVPLVPAPPPPASVEVTYDESAVAIAWPPLAAQVGADEDVLPSSPFGVTPPTFGFEVYEMPAEESTGGTGRRLTSSPITATRYTDTDMTWGDRRCYTVRTIETIGGLPIESRAATPACVTLTDTFPPAPPKGLTAVASEHAISLIWQPNTEKDLAGYIVLRGSNGGPLAPITPAPIQDATYHDDVQPGVRFTYAVRAVDKAGNESAPSNRVDEVAR
ncbi:MAG: fibronectin type III domain-containing protein [Betaproteobacteria bacterium]